MKIEISEHQARILRDLLATDMEYLEDAINSEESKEDKKDIKKELEAEKDLFNKVNI